MAKVLIIADDLTGAADCGAAFAGRGVEARVLLRQPGEDGVDVSWNGAEVLAIDADTRRLPPEQAAEAVARLVHSPGGIEGNAVLIFKKVDSTLRGNVGPELAASLRSRRVSRSPSERAAMVFAPAFPGQGRTTVKGRQMVNGQLLDRVGSRQSDNDDAHGDLNAMVRRAGLSCQLIDVATVRARTGKLETELKRIAHEADVAICDAETEDDLRSIVQAGRMTETDMVWAGSAGLARHLAHAVAFEREGGCGAKPLVEVQHGPILFVVGSPASVSREQARLLAAAGSVACFTFPELRGESPSESEACAAMIAERLANGEDVLVELEVRDRYAVEQDRGFARLLGRAIRPCAATVGALVATGGETARAILDAWGIRSLRLAGEVESGLPYSVAEFGNRNIWILTKAGGFGTRETLLRCRDFLLRAARREDQQKAAARVEGRTS